MRVIKPLAVTDTNLTSSTIPEPDATQGEIEWSAGTYTTGQQRILTSTHRVYEVVADPSTSDDPLTGIAANPPTWIDVKATNKYAMFDNKNSSSSIDNMDLGVTIAPQFNANSIAGFYIDGATNINLSVIDGATTIYSRDVFMRDNSERVSWYNFFFSPVVFIDRFVLTDLPPSLNKDIVLTMDGNGDISIGNLVVGSFTELGTTVYGTSWNGLDFSIREPDGFGGFKVTRRRTADLMDYDCYTPREKFSFVKKQLKDLAQEETVWIGDFTDVNDGTAVFGYHNDSTINISSPSVIDMTIQVQELI